LECKNSQLFFKQAFPIKDVNQEIMMRFDRIKANWPIRRFEGYLFTRRPGQEIVSDVRLRMKEIGHRELMQDFQNALFMLMVAVLLIGVGRSPLAFWGINLLMAAAIVEVAAYIQLYFEYRDRKDDLSIKDLLIKERRWILTRMRILTGSMNLSAALAIVGCALLILSFGYSPIYRFLAIIGAVLLFAIIEKLYHHKIKKTICMRLHDIDLRLARCKQYGA
jgi:hypothetical protein